MITYLIISQIRKKGAKKRYINPFKKLVNLLLDKLYPTEHSESHLDNISSDIEGESTKPPSGNTIFLNQADIKIKLMELDSQKSAVDNKALLGAIRNEVTNVIQLSEERQIKRTQVLENKLEELNSMVQDLSMAYKAQMKEKKLK